MASIAKGSVYTFDSSKISNDFIGFTFNNIHSSTLGIYRVSDGSRYNEDLLPSISDTTLEVPGRDGTYFFESKYTSKSISISIAYDSLTEVQFRKLRQVFSLKTITSLTFDEEPYKTYKVKVASSPNLEYLCFDEGGQRIYKGEGSIEFIAYYPYAICEKKYLSEYADATYPNKNEWKGASGLLSAQGNYDATNSGRILIYNPGDLEADFQAYYTFTDAKVNLTSIYLSRSASTLGILNFSGNISRKKTSDIYLRISSETELLEGCNSSKKPTGTIYNEYITTGEFFKIPIITSSGTYFVSDGATCTNLDYNYLYY